ncbi:MAG: ComEC/Rec2 family competence protein [Novosphingobium sp.]|nr:ComEC/Rec2 family competence protein [Novosphingobium sp.]
MASDATLARIDGDEPALGAALQHRPWRVAARLSSGLAAAERFLAQAGYDRAPWVAVAFAVGIGLWFELPGRWEWLALVASSCGVALAAAALLGRDGGHPYLRQSVVVLAAALAAGCLVIWAKAALVGTPPIARPIVTELTGRVVDREEQPAESRVRLVLVTRIADENRAVRVRINVPLVADDARAGEGAIVKLRARLMPPAPPMLPGAYDFARVAWFDGIAATGGAIGPVILAAPAHGGGLLAPLQHALADHVRAQIAGSPGGVAATFASGDRGGIAPADEQAMRDGGLTHLLSISGLHVSAVIAGAYLLAMRLLGLWPWLALRVRLPLLAAAVGAAAGLAYTLLTGAQVPTVRSCVGALLVLLAVAIGREALSLRMLAVGALVVMLMWPEAVVGPSFQMSFAAVLAIIAVHGAAPVRAFLAHRDEPWWRRLARDAVMLLGTGFVIEAALTPISMFHFHRSGIYSAFANVIAIPLTTFVSMPLIALALALDCIGLGAPVWWLVGKSLGLLLTVAHVTARQPGAVTHWPTLGAGGFALFIAGGLWLALWRGKVRLLGLVPALLGVVVLAGLRSPDVLVSGDGHHVGITGLGPSGLILLRDERSSYARDNLAEVAGMDGKATTLADWPGARCSPDFCVVQLNRGGRDWLLLIARGKDPVAERDLAAACERVDIVIADRWVPRSCKPRVLKADRTLLARTGGLAIDLGRSRITTVAEGEGEHGWWRASDPHPPQQWRSRSLHDGLKSDASFARFHPRSADAAAQAILPAQ